MNILLHSAPQVVILLTSRYGTGTAIPAGREVQTHETLAGEAQTAVNA